MANITKTEWASLIPVVWSDAILAQLRSYIVAARLVSRLTDKNFAAVGDTFRIGKIGALTAVDKVAGTAVTRQAPAASSQDLVLNKHKVVPFLVEDAAAGTALGSSIEAQTREAVRALVEQLESDVLAAIVANSTNVLGTAGTDAAESLLLTLRKAFSDQKVPQDAERNAIWATKDVNALLTTSTSKFTNANTRGDAGDALRTADLGELYRVRHYESQLINVVIGTPNTTQNVAFVPEAVVLAMRTLSIPPESTGVKAAVSVDEVSGLAVRVVFQYDINALGIAANVDLLYGVKVVRPEWTAYVKT